jgi:hypothetical protein
VQDTPGTKLTNENMLINDLFREYLAFNNYRSSLSVFQAGAPRRCLLATQPTQNKALARGARPGGYFDHNWIRAPDLTSAGRGERRVPVTQRVVSLRCRWVARSWRSSCGYPKMTSLLSCTSTAVGCCPCQSSDDDVESCWLDASRSEAEEH